MTEQIKRKRGRPKKAMETKLTDSNEQHEKTLEKLTESPKETFVEIPNSADMAHVITYSTPGIEIKKDVDNKPANIPPINAGIRNSFGLLENLRYVFDDSGYVNYKALLKSEHLTLNRQKKDEIERIYGKKFNEIDIVKDGIDDKYILVLLSGIRFLCLVRGFTSCTFSYSGDSERVAALCQIRFLGNYETNGNDVTFESTAERSKHSTVLPFSNYLVSLAENAAYVRTVRNFLRLPILAQDEIMGVKENGNSEQTNNIDPTSPHHALQNNMDKYKVSWGQLQSALIKKEKDGQKLYPDAAQWTNVLTVPKEKVYGIIGLLVDAQNKNGVK